MGTVVGAALVGVTVGGRVGLGVAVGDEPLACLVAATTVEVGVGGGVEDGASVGVLVGVGVACDLPQPVSSADTVSRAASAKTSNTNAARCAGRDTRRVVRRAGLSDLCNPFSSSVESGKSILQIGAIVKRLAYSAFSDKKEAT
jgi:hypothetical protein